MGTMILKASQSQFVRGQGVDVETSNISSCRALIKQRDLEIGDLREEILHLTRVAELSEIVSSLAHEINQPLTAIQSYAQAALRMLAGREPQIQEILKYIINDDQRASEVIGHLRSLLKKDKSVFKPLSINALVNGGIGDSFRH